MHIAPKKVAIRLNNTTSDESRVTSPLKKKVAVGRVEPDKKSLTVFAYLY